jgi:hypothetical protein
MAEPRNIVVRSHFGHMVEKLVVPTPSFVNAYQHIHFGIICCFYEINSASFRCVTFQRTACPPVARLSNSMTNCRPGRRRVHSAAAVDANCAWALLDYFQLSRIQPTVVYWCGINGNTHTYISGQDGQSLLEDRPSDRLRARWRRKRALVAEKAGILRRVR